MLGHQFGAVDVEHDGAGSAAVCGDVVVGAGEPRGDLFRVAGRLILPAFPDDAAGVFGAASDRQHIPSGFGPCQRGRQIVSVGVDVGH